MIAIDKLIFNALASHSNVNMPGLGSLLSQRQPAKLKGRKTLTPPRNRMVFSYESLPLALNLVELIVRQTGDEPGARDLYEQWLNAHGIRKGQELPSRITFEGLGEINGKAFTPSPELDKVLNPVGGRAIQLTPRVQSKQIAIIAGVVAVVIVGLFIYFHRSPEERRHAYQEQMARDLERRNLERAQKGMEMVTADQAPPGLDGTDAADAQPATQTASTPAATAAGPLYHVVFGVFSTPENADKFIREFKAKDTQTAVSFTVVKMGNGKLVVSGFASADEKQADAKRKQYAAQYPGLWIYKQKK